MTTSCDVLVIGGGVVGLWAAKFAAWAGLDTILLEKAKCGNGGSGGVLGALLPHLPNAMNEKNRFQFDALAELPELIARLEDEAGASTGYSQCGRLMPVRHEGFLKTVDLCISKSEENWIKDDQKFSFEKVESDRYAHWLDPEKAPLGLAWDNLAAKVHPESYISALKKSMSGAARIIEGAEVIQLDHKSGEVKSADGESFSASQIILAAGHQTYDILENLTGISFGKGVKGQAALFELDLNQQQPVIYDDGMYIVHHSPGYCAVGSTTEPNWEQEHTPFKEKSRKFIEKAWGVCPPIRNKEPRSLWAGVRPKSHAKDPILGRLSSDSRLHIATGGFKISFGIAHRIAEYLVSEIAQSEHKIVLPRTYNIEHHIECGVDMGRIEQSELDRL